MPNIRKLDPTTSPMHHLGAELRRYREAAGLTQDQLGGKVFCTGSLIGQYETAKKIPTSRFTMQLDDVLNTDGSLLRLLKMALCFGVPLEFKDHSELEAEATQKFVFEMTVVNGLLQTPDYARAVLGVLHKDELESRLEQRLSRQHILHRERPPLLWAVFGEGALCQGIGGRDVMRAQLAHLLGFRDHPRVHIQILPFTAGAHAGFQGAFSLLRFKNSPDLAYDETYRAGHMSADPEYVADLSLRYAHLQAAAMSVQDSADLIAHVMEERYGTQS
ncbi:helix-turn-helix domain-containing protein [Streptomyces sp. NEAU-Y11]|uniref:helix-turn-helix domain-containing protein n=1 Tax=Streptomyces cucumeris TaxID=2962890 RepID=UPI0020C8EE9D|nr:helix-turn-helix transcriptional regulator [Streptomyces sp. NEAU-Y11]MCP9208436.1 helix-turn-helix domain-containing protein [Streptomyces sp. NEAU-Y11]